MLLPYHRSSDEIIHGSSDEIIHDTIAYLDDDIPDLHMDDITGLQIDSKHSGRAYRTKVQILTALQVQKYKF
jgi:hypothetical protein